jgi:hypothetical protein
MRSNVYHVLCVPARINLDRYFHSHVFTFWKLELVQNEHNILEPALGRPFGYSAYHCSKSLLMKDFIPFLSNYAHSFTTTHAFFSL